VFGRGRHRRRRGGRRVSQLTEAAALEAQDLEEDDGPVEGPYDESQAPDDGASRLDLGSVRLPLPEESQIQVEVDPAGPVRAVHILTEHGRITVNAFAAPRSEELWGRVSGEIARQLTADGGQVTELDGEWGPEVHAVTPQANVRFVGVDGPRWMLRGMAVGPADRHERLVEALYEMLRGTVVVRGAEALPAESQLPITLPPPMAEQLRQAAEAQQAQAQQPGRPGHAG
jgi:Protein of unknown function (DUF3710)